MVISKPCIHPDCPPREGFIRGQYESVEFIREIPQRPKRVSSTNELLKKAGRARATSSSLDRVARLRSAHESIDQSERESVLTADTRTGDDSRLSLDDSASRTGRQRGRTISFAESRGLSAKGEAVDTCNDESDELEETNPVEWIMVTRSDPGGSVPRFLVERGTPSGIVADASKFLDWAIKKEHEEPRNEDLETEEHDMKNANASHNVDQDLEAYQTNGHLAGLNGASEEESIKTSPIPAIEEPAGFPELENSDQNHQEGLLASVTNIALPSIESYAPQIVIDRLANHHTSPSVLADARSPSASVNTGSEVNDANMTHTTQDRGEPESISSSSSIVSFASAEDHFEDAFSRQATSSLTDPLDGTSAAMSPHDKELTKLIERKKILDEKLAKTREKELKDKEEITSREEERLRKAEEKHAREIQKQEEKYKKEVAKLEAKRAKDAAKEEERKRKAEEKDEKARLTREKEEFKQLLAVVSKERDILKEQVGALQRENTALVAKMGKMGEGQDLLREVKSEMLGGVRSRSGSLRKARPASPVLGPAPTVLAGGKQEPKNEPSPLSDT